MKCLGARVATCYGSPRFKREVEDLAYIEEYVGENPFRGLIWKLSCDYGRGYIWLAGWFILAACLYARFYESHPSDIELPEWATEGGAGNEWIASLYFSIVTLTTLGFGDITPSSPLGAKVVISQVILGYILLGLLISVLADKVARRSES